MLIFRTITEILWIFGLIFFRPMIWLLLHWNLRFYFHRVESATIHIYIVSINRDPISGPPGVTILESDVVLWKEWRQTGVHRTALSADVKVKTSTARLSFSTETSHRPTPFKTVITAVPLKRPILEMLPTNFSSLQRDFSYSEARVDELQLRWISPEAHPKSS